MLSRNLLDPRSQQEYKSDDPIRQGFFDSTFFKPNAPSTMDVVNYTYQGNPMGGSSSQISQFRNYLDSIGKGDLLVNQNSGSLAQVGSGPLATSDTYSPTTDDAYYARKYYARKYNGRN